MARYVCRVRTPRSQDDAFAYMADLGHFAEWDPSVVRAERVATDGATGDVYDVEIRAGSRTFTLRYVFTRAGEPTTNGRLGRLGSVADDGRGDAFHSRH